MANVLLILQIKCSSEDYQILMACLTENISASTPAPPKPPAIAGAPQLITTVAVIEEKKEPKLRAPVQRTTSRRGNFSVKNNRKIEH